MPLILLFTRAYALACIMMLAVGIFIFFAKGFEPAEKFIFETNLQIYLTPLMAVVQVKYFDWKTVSSFDKFGGFIMITVSVILIAIFTASSFAE